MIAGSLTYDTKLDTKGFDKGLGKLNTKAVAVGNLIADAFKGISKAMGEVVKQGIQYNGQIEQYQVALTTLTGSAEKSQKIMEQIKEDASKTPFNVKGLTEANQLLISTGLDSNKARQDILNLGNAISATGGGNEELSRMAVNLQQIKNVGKASALDIKQFAFAGIDVYGLLADSMGITREEATQLDVTYEQLTDALSYASQEGGKYFGAMEAQSKTLNGQLSTLKDNFMSFIGDALQPLFNFLKDTVLPIINSIMDGSMDATDGIIKLVEELSNKVIDLAVKLVEMLPDIIPKVIDLMMKILQTILDNLPAILQAGIDIVIALIMGLVQAMPDLIPIIIDAILLIVEVLIDNLDLIVDAGIELIVALIEGIFNALPDLIAKLPELVLKLSIALIKLIVVTLPEAGRKIVTSLVDGLFSYYGKMIQKIREFFKGTIFEPIINKVTDMASAGLNLIKGLWNGIKNAQNWLLGKIKGFAKSITSGIKKFFGIHSPSKVMQDEVGQWLPKGIAVGIDANTDSALKSIDNMNDEIMNKMRQAVDVETSKASFGGINGSVSEILNTNSTIKVENYNTLELDGEKVYENQEKIKRNKNLQYSFGGAE